MRDEDFPFDVVYEHFARRAVDAWVVEENRPKPPMMFTVAVEDGELLGVIPYPVHPLFSSERGKDMMGLLLERIVPKIPDGACMVLMSEAWVLFKPYKPGDPLPERSEGSLGDNPESRECVLVNIYRPRVSRVGHLMVGADRKLVYSPLETGYISMGGRFMPEPGPGEDDGVH